MARWNRQINEHMKVMVEKEEMYMKRMTEITIPDWKMDSMASKIVDEIIIGSKNLTVKEGVDALNNEIITLGIYNSGIYVHCPDIFKIRVQMKVTSKITTILSAISNLMKVEEYRNEDTFKEINEIFDHIKRRYDEFFELFSKEVMEKNETDKDN